MRRVVHFASAVGTGTSTTSAEVAIAEYAFGVGELQPGRIIRYESLVTSPTVTAGGDTLRLRVRFGTSATASANTEIAVGAAIAVAANSIASVRGSIHIQSAIRYVHLASISALAASGVGTATESGVVFVAVADTAYYLSITADWSTADANVAQAECWAITEDEV
jgi:hypothetical protein